MVADYPSFINDCIYAEFFIDELDLENDRGVVETSFLSLIACFFKNKILSNCPLSASIDRFHVTSLLSKIKN